MNPLAGPDARTTLKGLTRDDLFSLHAVLQHGSLTAEEHAHVFSGSAESSQAAFERLRGRGILEVDPQSPGFRVRFASAMLVWSALNVENL